MAEKGKGDAGEKVLAVLSYVFILWILPLWIVKPRKDFSVYHAKQGLVLFIAAIVVWFLSFILMFIPVLGWLIMAALWVVLFVLWVMGIANAVMDKKAPLPIIGKWAEEWFKEL